MDAPHLLRSLDHNRENQIQLWSRSLDLGSRAAAWVLAGNGGALLVCFNAATSGQTFDWDTLRLVASLFLLGLAAAFLSVLCEQRSFEAFSLSLALFVAKGTAALGLLDQQKQLIELSKEQLDEELVQSIREVREQLRSLNSEIQNYDLTSGGAKKWMKAANWILALSCVSFGGGILIALWRLPGALH
ncbi:MAG: hypothetical protein ABL889_17960 [Terricaulis sp.]